VRHRTLLHFLFPRLASSWVLGVNWSSASSKSWRRRLFAPNPHESRRNKPGAHSHRSELRLSLAARKLSLHNPKRSIVAMEVRGMIRFVSRVSFIVLLTTFVWAEQIQVRMNSRLSSESTAAGSAFQGVLVSPVHINGYDCAKGGTVGGVVTESKRSGRLSSPGVLTLQPTWISCHGRRMPVSAEPVTLEGRSHTKKNAALIGGGAGLGAVLGGIFGGGKGALIGAGAGAAAGIVGAASTGRHEAVIEAEAVVGWDITSTANPPENTRQHAGSVENYRDSDHHAYRRHSDDNDEGDQYARNSQPIRFTEHDRIYLSRCLSSNYQLPPGLAKKGKVPPGHAKKMQRSDYTAIPSACTAELSTIPYGWERVIIDTRVVLLDARHREIDSFLW
jgi:hypothetical protein